MPLKMRPTGLGHGVYKDNVDFGVYCGEWCIGRIYDQIRRGRLVRSRLGNSQLPRLTAGLFVLC